MRKKVIVANRLEEEVLDELKKHVELKCFFDISSTEKEALVKELHDTDGISGYGLEVNEELLEKAPNLKIVSNVSVGYNNSDIAAMTERNVMATNTPDVLTDTVADAIFGRL